MQDAMAGCLIGLGTGRKNSGDDSGGWGTRHKVMGGNQISGGTRRKVLGGNQISWKDPGLRPEFSCI